MRHSHLILSLKRHCINRRGNIFSNEIINSCDLLQNRSGVEDGKKKVGVKICRNEMIGHELIMYKLGAVYTL